MEWITRAALYMEKKRGSIIIAVGFDEFDG